MKKLILSLIAMCSIYAAHAQSCVTIQQVSTNYATNQITFDVKWGTCNNTNHLYRVWVFVDYRPVTNIMKGAWDRAAIAATDKGTLVSANNGVWITGSANATQRVTLTLDVIGDKFDWCAFASDYPPQADIDVYRNVSFKGSLPFVVTYFDGSSYAVNTATGYRLAAGKMVKSITDATGCPGNIYYCNCNLSNFSLGTVGFATAQTWAIGSQTWSDAVTTNYCANKTAFSGASDGRYNADCRSDPSYSGDMFSWCMVAQYADQLCPSPWRVPTRDDFCYLFKTISGASTCPQPEGQSELPVANLIVSKWGNEYNGLCEVDGTLRTSVRGVESMYWAIDEYTENSAYRWCSWNGGIIRPTTDHPKLTGFHLRCVR